MSTPHTFAGGFTEQDALPPEAIAAVQQLMESGKLHRYSAGSIEGSNVAMLEREYRDWQECRYCLAVTSGGQAMQIALRAAGVQPGDQVLMNAFTLAPVPGAVAAVGARAVLVEIDDTLTIDMDDLTEKARASGAKFLLLSHMRCHLCDMERLVAICADLNLTVIEDCAHTMGAKWAGVRSGNYGHVACFSTQSYKHMNSGEGGLITTDDPLIMARAILFSGSYMFYDRHGAGPDREVFAQVVGETPNMSARMDELRAAILRPQIALIEPRVSHWNTLYRALETALLQTPGVEIPPRPEKEEMASSSLQFRVPDFSVAQCLALIAAADARGVTLKWFGADKPAGYTSQASAWTYIEAQALPKTETILSRLFDVRLSPKFSAEDCSVIGLIIGEEIARL